MAMKKLLTTLAVAGAAMAASTAAHAGCITYQSSAAVIIDYAYAGEDGRWMLPRTAGTNHTFKHCEPGPMKFKARPELIGWGETVWNIGADDHLVMTYSGTVFGLDHWQKTNPLNSYECRSKGLPCEVNQKWLNDKSAE